MLDRDLAELYGVETRVINQAVTRNRERFPEDFVFQLTKDERDEVITICDHLRLLKYAVYPPYAFTENGVAMLSSVLKSQRAILVNVQIMRTFTKLRELISTHKDLAQKIAELESKFESHDGQISKIFAAIRRLVNPPVKHRREIGFRLSPGRQTQ